MHLWPGLSTTQSHQIRGGGGGGDTHLFVLLQMNVANTLVVHYLLLWLWVQKDMRHIFDA